jgi:7-cyano-7-deazaguanine synthase
LRHIVLLSGGLDSVVNFKCALDEGEVTLALTFDYGQSAFADEAAAAGCCAERYSIGHEVVELGWYKALVNRPVVGRGRLGAFPQGLPGDTQRLLEEAWIPNRNCVFLSIGAAYAEALGAERIVIGINREEAEVFPDNSQAFLDGMNEAFAVSTLSGVRAVSYTAALSKREIVELGIRVGAPLETVYSCYKRSEGGRRCGVCQSCIRLKSAFREEDILDKFTARFVE